MEETFGKKMERFALSVDIVDENTWSNAKAKIEEYLKKLKIDNFRLLVERTLENGEAVLHSEWTMGDKDWGLTIKDHRGRYIGQNAFAYDTNKCLWVVGKNKEPLSEASKYKDLWAETNPREIPESKAEGDIYTSIFIPLMDRDKKKKEGMVNFESRDYLDCTPARKEEFKTIADAIRILFHLHSTHEIRKKSTQTVLTNLKVEEEVILPKPKDQVFLAYSEKADQKVIDAIKDLLSKKYEKEFEVIDWKENPEPGSISQKLAKDILNCEYGICYFSELSDKSPGCRFIDNPNVLIEAGMFYILMKKKTIGNLKGWIPIREEDQLHCDKLPFDLADLRILWVDRQKGEKDEMEFKEKDFKEQLERTIKCLKPNVND